jgi:hypothetical protein
MSGHRCPELRRQHDHTDRAELPGLDPVLANLYALLALTKGEETSLEDVHDAWAVWTATTRGVHRSLIPFAELSPEVQELDRKYVDGIHRAALT